MPTTTTDVLSQGSPGGATPASIQSPLDSLPLTVCNILNTDASSTTDTSSTTSLRTALTDHGNTQTQGSPGGVLPNSASNPPPDSHTAKVRQDLLLQHSKLFECSVVKTNSDTQTTGCQTPFLSPFTASEMIPKLNYNQASRELKYFASVNPCFKPKTTKDNKGKPTRTAINNSLYQVFTSSLVSDFDIIADNFKTSNDVILSFSYMAKRLNEEANSIRTRVQKISEDLRKYDTEVNGTHTQLQELRAQVDSLNSSQVTLKNNICNTNYQNTTADNDNYHNNNNVKESSSAQSTHNIEEILSVLDEGQLPAYKLQLPQFCNIDTDYLDKYTHYTHTRNGRHIAHYGPYPYNYTGVKHDPRPVANNPPLLDIFKAITREFPTLELNSALVQKYPNGQSNIPIHSDNEPEIKPGSTILTLSLGETRTFMFRSLSKNESGQESNYATKVSNGDIIIMTRDSQDSFVHRILPDNTESMRISITFRCLTNIHNKPPAPKKTIIPEISNPKGGKPSVLVLTDSILDKSISDLQKQYQNVTVNKLSMYQLLHIDRYMDRFFTHDVVVISAGVNDLSRYGETGDSLLYKVKQKLDHITNVCPNTTFIFRSICPTRFELLNSEIIKFNVEFYKYTLGIGNLFFFDTNGLPGRDFLDPRGNGVHLERQLARALANHILQHASCLAQRNRIPDPAKKPVSPCPWPLRDFLRNLR